jgi:diguanylate cyclase (GGDEF)-like protein/PAS domain S-box-containing protein
VGKFRFSLLKKAFAATLLILLPILITFIVSYGKNRELLEKHLLEDLSLISDGFEVQVYQFIEMAKRRTVDFATDGSIISVLREGRTSSRELSDHLLRNKLPIDSQIHAIAVISSKGRVVASTDPALQDRDFSSSPLFTSTKDSPSLIEMRHGTKGVPELAVSAPVKDHNGASLGIVTNFILVPALENVLTGEFTKELGAITSGPGPRQTLEAYIVNKDGLMITGSKFIKNAVLKQRVDTEPVKACLERRQEITGFYNDYRGVEVAGASMCMPTLNWTLLVEIDSSEAMLPVAAIGRNAIIAAIAVIFLVCVLLLVFYRTIIAQLREISMAALSISKGDYGARVPVRSTDEIGLLSETFNIMAGQISERSTALTESEERLKAILDNSSAIVYLKDLDGRYIFVNQAYAAILRLGRDEVALRTDYDLFAADMADRFRANDLLALGALAAREFEETLAREDGAHTYIAIKFPLLHASGKPYAVCGFLTDITGRKKMELALKESEERLERAQQITHMGSWDWDVVNNRLWWSDEIYRIFGLERSQFDATYEAFIKTVHPGDREFVEHSVQQAFYNRKPYSIEHRIVLPGGEEKTVHEDGDLILDADGKPMRMIGTVQDITERKKSEFELKKLSAVIENSVNLVFVTDSHGTIEYVNPTFEEVTGYTKNDALGQNPRILASGEVSNSLYQEMWRTILSGQTWRGTMKNRRKSGGYYWAASVITPIRNEQGEITHFLAVQEDVTAKMMSEERIKYLANFDELTGLVNRSRFIELVEEWTNMARGRGKRAVMCLIDMDQFKLLNDTFGHGVGDEYLRRISKVLEATLENVYKRGPASFDNKPLISRLSGDEFAVYLPGFSEAEGIETAEEIKKSVEGFYFGEASSALTISLGLAAFPEHGSNVKDLLTKADAAMFRAKELGRNRVHAYRAEDHDLEKMHSRLAWRERISRGLKEDRFTPWFQPLLDLASGRVHHYEALARLIDADGKVVLPGAFIDNAERFGIVGLIDRMIIEKTMKTQADMMKKGVSLSFAMNLSGKDLGDAELLDYIKGKIGETGADPKSLVFEITETAAIGDLDKATKFVRALKELGCQFSLDDFGVGFTSFTYLKELQVDFIKIDGSFIRKLHESPNDQVFVKAITDLARGLRIKSVAEFVENEESLKLLKSYGVDFAQGYLVGKPSPGLELAGEEFPLTKMQKPSAP